MSADVKPRASRGPSRLPGAANIGGTLLILIAVLSVALRAQTASPPAIAEFAPQAQQIKSAPAEQTSTLGSGEGGAALGTPPSPSPIPSPSPPDLNGAIISNSCIGDPPRQIQDPQSPPCIPYWKGNNGGPTSRGVDQTSISIGETQSGPQLTALQDAVTFFNSHFMLYGRHITLQDFSGDNQGSGAPGQRAEADHEASMNIFAAMNDNNGGGISYGDQLAKDGVIATYVRPYLTEGYMASHAPYVYSYPMAFDTLERTFAAWACARLKGGKAVHAGVGSVGLPRKFGLVYTYENLDVAATDQVFKDSLNSCGISLAYEAQPDSGGESTQDERSNNLNSMINMKTNGVTTIFCLCDRVIMNDDMQDADNQGYNPEWVVSSYDLMDDDAEIRTLVNSTTQKQHLFGISAFPMARQFGDRPSTWDTPQDPYQSETAEVGRDYMYRNLLLIAAGIQMAGPHLTPQSFQAGLQRAQFPNPPNAIMAGKVGFNGGSHAMTIDVAEFWWSNVDPGPLPDETSGGAWCYVDHGARHSLADPWPAGDPGFFNPPCDSGNEPAGSG